MIQLSNRNISINMHVYRCNIPVVISVISCALITISGYIKTKITPNKMNYANYSNVGIPIENENVLIQSNERVNWTWFGIDNFISHPRSKHVETKLQGHIIKFWSVKKMILFF